MRIVFPEIAPAYGQAAFIGAERRAYGVDAESRYFFDQKVFPWADFIAEMHGLLLSVHQNPDGIYGIITLPPRTEAGYHIIPVVYGQSPPFSAHCDNGHIGAEGFFAAFGQRDGACEVASHAGEQENQTVIHKTGINSAAERGEDTVGTQSKIPFEFHPAMRRKASTMRSW